MYKALALLSAILVFASVFSRSVLGDLTRDQSADGTCRPRHAIAVLGDDRYACSANEVRFQDAEHILAIGSDVVCFDVASGKRVELAKEVWLFDTERRSDRSVIAVWDAGTRHPKREIELAGQKLALALSDDGQLLAVLETKYNDLHIDIVDVETGETTDTIPSPDFHSGNSQDDPRAWFLRSGRVVAVAHRMPQNRDLRFRFFALSEDGKIGKLISEAILSEGNNRWKMFPTENDDHVLFVGLDGSILLQNFNNGKTASSVKIPVSAFHAAVNRRNSVLAVCGNWGPIYLWDVANERPLGEIATGEGRVWSLDFSPDGRVLASRGSFGRIRFWAVRTGKELYARTNPHFGTPVSVALSPDSLSVAVADARGNAEMWDVGTGAKMILEDDPIPNIGGFDPWVGTTFFAFSPDGETLIGGSNAAHNSVNIWNVVSGKRIKRLTGHGSPIMSVACSADGTRFASTSRDSTLRIWDRQGNLLHTFQDASASLAFFPENDRIAACHGHGKGDGLRVYDLQKGRMERQFHAPSEIAARSPWAYCVAVAPDGQRLASVHRDGVVRIWDVDVAGPIREIRLREDGVRSSHTPGSVFFLPDGKTLIASAGTSSIFVCDWKSGAVRTQLDGHRSVVRSLAFNEDCSLMASADGGCHVIVWDMNSVLAQVD